MMALRPRHGLVETRIEEEETVDAVVQWWTSLGALYQSIAVVTGGLGAYVLFRVILVGRMERMAASTSNDIDDRLVHFAKQFLWLITLFAVVAVVLRINGVAISPLLAGAGILGVSLGFAAKETIADILSGIFLIADRPVRVGDRVKVENIGRHWGAWGDVVDIGLRRTRIRNTDGVTVNYPNALLANSVITNFSFEPGPIRVRVRFQVDYTADIDRMRQVVVQAVESCAPVLADSAQVVVRSLWDDNQGHLLAGVLVEARYRIDEVRNRTAIRSEVLQNILAVLKSNDIPLATPRVHVG